MIPKYRERQMINSLLPYWHFLQRHFRSVYHDRHFDGPVISQFNLFILSGYVGCERQHFLSTPTDSEVTEGDTAILQCQVGNQIGQVQWTKDGLTLGWFIVTNLSGDDSIFVLQVLIVTSQDLIVTQSLAMTLMVLLIWRWSAPSKMTRRSTSAKLVQEKAILQSEPVLSSPLIVGLFILFFPSPYF